MLKLTPTEHRIYEALADGEPHKTAELLPLVDELADPSALYKHMYRLRLKLKQEGEDVIAQKLANQAFGYRRIRHLCSESQANGT